MALRYEFLDPQKNLFSARLGAERRNKTLSTSCLSLCLMGKSFTSAQLESVLTTRPIGMNFAFGIVLWGKTSELWEMAASLSILWASRCLFVDTNRSNL